MVVDSALLRMVARNEFEIIVGKLRDRIAEKPGGPNQNPRDHPHKMNRLSSNPEKGKNEVFETKPNDAFESTVAL